MILTQTELSTMLDVLRHVNVFGNRHLLGIIPAVLLPAEPGMLCLPTRKSGCPSDCGRGTLRAVPMPSKFDCDGYFSQ